jgi:hypothetical protein
MCRPWFLIHCIGSALINTSMPGTTALSSFPILFLVNLHIVSLAQELPSRTLTNFLTRSREMGIYLSPQLHAYFGDCSNLVELLTDVRNLHAISRSVNIRRLFSLPMEFIFLHPYLWLYHPIHSIFPKAKGH